MVSSIHEFMELKPAWDNLSSNYDSYYPFLSHEWFDIWLDHFLSKYDTLFIAVISRKDNDQIIAIFPLIRKVSYFKKIRISKIESIGNVYSPARFYLIDKNQISERNALLVLFTYLTKYQKAWHLFDLNSIAEELLSIEEIENSCRRTHCKYSQYFCFGNWYLDNINFTSEEYISNRKSNIRKNAARYKRKLSEIGDLKIEIVTDTADLDRHMDDYYSVYGKSWKRRESDPTLHRDLAKMAARNGWLRLGFLFISGKPIASQLWFSCNKYAYILKLSYDEEYKKYIPGVILTIEMVKYVIDKDKVTEIDYLIGDESYKKDWTPKRRERKGVWIFNDNIKGKYLALLTNKVQPAINKHKYLYKCKEVIKKCLPQS